MVTSVACMGDDEGEGPVLRNLQGTGREEGKRVGRVGRARSGNGRGHVISVDPGLG